jgi:hypothetical protein
MKSLRLTLCFALAVMFLLPVTEMVCEMKYIHKISNISGEIFVRILVVTP